jgi:opacity protein-like surface antigen
MKTLLATAALAAVIASPALAQTVVRRPAAQPPVAQADQYGRTEGQRRSANPNTVYEGDVYLGADPDPNVRLNLRMDYEHHD